MVFPKSPPRNSVIFNYVRLCIQNKAVNFIPIMLICRRYPLAIPINSGNVVAKRR